MTREEMIAVVSAEVSRLEQIRQLLLKSHSERFQLQDAPRTTRKPGTSTETRRRIGLAQTRRRARQGNSGVFEAK